MSSQREEQTRVRIRTAWCERGERKGLRDSGINTSGGCRRGDEARGEWWAKRDLAADGCGFGFKTHGDSGPSESVFHLPHAAQSLPNLVSPIFY
jgi:hypothetical protein